MTLLNWREGFHFFKWKWTQFKIFQWNLLMVWSSVLLDTCTGILQPNYFKSEAVFTSIFVCNTFLHVSSRQSLTINTCIGCVVHGQTLIVSFYSLFSRQYIFASQELNLLCSSWLGILGTCEQHHFQPINFVCMNSE